MNPVVTDDELFAFESLVLSALKRGDEASIRVLGYGEVSTVLALEAAAGPVACKRTPGFHSRQAAELWAQLIHDYVEGLEQRGLAIVPTDVRLVDGDDGATALYCIQPVLPAGSLGPDHFAKLELAAVIDAAKRVFALIRASVSSTIAPDGQLSNWAFVGDDILYLDVGSPFLRDERGRPLLDWEHQLEALPAPLRPFVRGKVLMGILDNYHSLRGQIVDFLGNLRKERLDRFTPRLLATANEMLDFDPPITAKEIDDYYLKDARTYALVQAARRADRWWQRKVLRRDYPYFLAPAIDRNL